jgi:SAM-dependent methyltransferase
MAIESVTPIPLDGGLVPRGRRMLRIPDDEVVRPSSPPNVAAPIASSLTRSTPPPYEVSGGPPIAASRIITINPPAAEDPPLEVRSPLFSVPEQSRATSDSAPSATLRRVQPESWTPFPATLETPRALAERVLQDIEDVSVHDPHVADKGVASDTAAAAKLAHDTKGPEIVVDEDLDGAPSPAAPSVEDVALDSEPPPRPSEPGELVEVSPEDFVSIESPPLRSVARSTASPVPAAAPAVSKKPPAARGPTPHQAAGAPPPSRSPRPPPPLLVPGLASPLAPPPMSEASAAARRKARPWWEELFNDDFIRTMAKVSDTQIVTEVNFIEESLGLAKGAMILDLACGTGRHAIEMTRRGYQVVGFDLSLAMLARAADEAQEFEQKLNFVQGDMREMTFGETFDGVYVWNTSFGFFEEEKNSAVIANVHRALKPGGLLLLDVANRDFVICQSPSLAWFEGDGCVCMDEMHVDWITSRMRVKRTVMMDDGRAKEIEYSIRIYALHELGKILHDQGFRVAEVSGRVATPGAFIGADSPRILVVAEKR